MTIDIRVPAEADLRPWIDAIELAFGEEMSDDRFSAFRRILELDRALAAYDGKRIVAGAGAFSFGLSVPGGREVRAAGVTVVGVIPTHRRRGILRELMRRQLADVHARGEPVAILWASEGSIYQRFGYGLATLSATLELERERARFREPREPVGVTRFIERDEAERLLPPIYEAVARRTPGFYSRSPDWWATQVLDDPPEQRRGASRMHFIVHERDGRADGYVRYRVRAEWDWVGPKSTLEVAELVAEEAAAERELWGFIFGVDLIARIKASLQPPDHPLLLMVQEPRRLRLTLGDALWLRILDVPAALEARGYRGSGSLVFEVADAFRPETAGRWRLEVADGRARVRASDDAPELAVDVTDLAAVYLGAFTFAQLVRAGRGVACVAGAVERADALFATAVGPACPQVF